MEAGSRKPLRLPDGRLQGSNHLSFSSRVTMGVPAGTLGYAAANGPNVSGLRRASRREHLPGLCVRDVCVPHSMGARRGASHPPAAACPRKSAREGEGGAVRDNALGTAWSCRNRDCGGGPLAPGGQPSRGRIGIIAAERPGCATRAADERQRRHGRSITRAAPLLRGFVLHGDDSCNPRLSDASRRTTDGPYAAAAGVQPTRGNRSGFNPLVASRHLVASKDELALSCLPAECRARQLARRADPVPYVSAVDLTLSAES